MKFLLAFLECLVGVVILVFLLLVAIFAKTEQLIDLQFRQKETFFPYFMMSVGLICFMAAAILLIIYAIKRGNK